jgi:hypothetical protein
MLHPRGFVAVLLGSLVLAACSHSTGRAGTAPSQTSLPHRDVLVAIGSAATFGIGLRIEDRLRDSWPQKLYHIAFARSTVLVNASEENATVSEAQSDQIPLALEERATVAVVWLGDDDLKLGEPATAFETDLDTLVARLRAVNVRVLIGNLPPSRSGAAAYNDAIARVASSLGATVVDVAAALTASPGSGPGSTVTPATSTMIARAFAAALARK